MTPEARTALAAYLKFQRDLGIDGLRVPAVLPPATAAAPKAASPVAPVVPSVAASRPVAETAARELLAIQTEIGPDCTRCKLSGLGRHKIVFGSGDPGAELVFVGEGPGADEDEQGVPFVGRGGQLLTDMIQKGMGLPRERVYICNVVKCRPPGNRTPEADECAACTPFLFRQLQAIRPRIVVALGATAAQALRPFKGSLGGVRGRLFDLKLGEFETKLAVTYHPAYLLRDPSQKKEAWKDLQLVMGYLGLDPPR